MAPLTAAGSPCFSNCYRLLRKIAVLETKMLTILPEYKSREDGRNGSSVTPWALEALDSLRRVLERVATAGLKLHAEKCHFMRSEVTFLGHKLRGEGISTVEDKRDREFIWTECQAAFHTLQRALTRPRCFPPDPSLPFILDTDASNVGTGAVLAQVGPEGERVVTYYSRTFNKTEHRYCVTRRELLSEVADSPHHSYYLCGLPFTVRTDHSALQWLMSFKEPEGQVACWMEELQAYSFTVVHRAGPRHSNADALSRRPCSEDSCRYCKWRESREEDLRAQEESCGSGGGATNPP
ncbi:hypothetical protein SKAU_G00411340 [Synaphobranchus kaupii]|uniref:Reverse transcriptase RNase H-like domain-containing protein n=1 Tax=Synaphobranchus kaupii TaxID=118154 RepID=A0A9Q1E7T5_SYNKA|nr:hypothetical protein SKAU_G00411340 [Synaphobranchus kaupii]